MAKLILVLIDSAILFCLGIILGILIENKNKN
jgi:hypothetical protein